MEYRLRPEDTERMPSGVPHIIANEAAERFSFYGMKAILAVFLSQYLFLMDEAGSKPMDEVRAAGFVHLFNFAFYITPIVGALLADVFFGKYKVIIGLSLVYCLGHLSLAMMGLVGHSEQFLLAGMIMLTLGAGGIKPCVSAHVGDQFGIKNAHLLPRVFNAFYFSINLGAFVSMLLTPWLLEWYGPHWAFGIPGVLMAIATLIFWAGRKRFTHIPAGGRSFVREVFSKEGLLAMLKLTPVYIFVAIFWALFDQTGTSWIFQSQDMDRNFLGYQWLPSQIQALNSVFVLTFIPLFSFIVYPCINKFWPLSPLRKMGMGFVIMALAFVLVSWIQMRIDLGERPNISWQILAFALLTVAEILVSIVALEFAYTQAPKKMKSLIMCFYLAAVAAGNLLVFGVNQWIRIPSAAEEQLERSLAELPQDWKNSPRTVILPGYDSADPKGAYIVRIHPKHKPPLEVPSQAVLEQAADQIIATAKSLHRFPDEMTAAKTIKNLKDHWGRDLRYSILNSSTVQITSRGADGLWDTPWDVGITIIRADPESEKSASWLDSLRPQETWLAQRKRQLGLSPSEKDSGETEYKKEPFSGGQVRLKGAAYFWFFTALMASAAILFIPLAMIYRPKNFLQDD